MARIGIDGTPLAAEGKGVARYLREFLSALTTLPTGHDYFIFTHEKVDSKNLPQHPQFKHVPLRFSNSLVWEQVLMPRAARNYKLDLFHTPLDRIPVFLKIPIVMYLFETPDYRNKLLASQERSVYSRLSRKLIHLLFPRSLKKAARIMVSSKSTRADLESRYRVKPGKIRLVYPAPKPGFHPAAEEERRRIRTKLKMPQGYVLHFSSDDPRDNTFMVLEAYARAVREFQGEMPPLVIPGMIRRSKDKISAKARELGILPRIKMPGFVPESELLELYQGAGIYFDPSLFEGFGFQVAEAMACGLPIITSNVSSLPELVADAGITAPPADAAAFSAALQKITADSALAAQMREKSVRESKKFSWKSHVEQTLQVFEEVLRG